MIYNTLYSDEFHFFANLATNSETFYSENQNENFQTNFVPTYKHNQMRNAL